MNTKAMACGNCGNGKFAVFQREMRTAYSKIQLVVECCECKSTTIIQPTSPELALGWGDNSQGILCVMEPNK